MKRLIFLAIVILLYRLENGKSLFHILPPLVDEYKVTYSQVCACLRDTENSPRNCRDPLSLAYPTLFKRDKNMVPLSPAFLCDVQKRDVSFSDDPTDEDFKLFSQTPQLRLRVKRDAVFEVSKENATKYCAERISETRIGKLCAKVGVNVQALVNICSVDIQVNTHVTLFTPRPPPPSSTHPPTHTHTHTSYSTWSVKFVFQKSELDGRTGHLEDESEEVYSCSVKPAHSCGTVRFT